MNEQQQLEQAITALEAQRAVLGDSVVDASVSTLKAKLALLANAQPGQQRKQATALMADISGFTALSETMDAEDVGALVNALWARLDEIILTHGGWIEKHIGDAVLALWGVKVSSESDPIRAAQAGLEMQAAVDEINRQSSTRLGMRIGIHTGGVLISEIGTQGEVSAMGDTVVSTTRLEEACPVGRVLVSADTYRHIRGRFEIEAFASSGKQEVAYLVIRQASRSFRNPARGIEGIETHMIGRDQELRLLQDVFRMTVSSQAARAVTLVAEAGLGKSRLLFEFERWVVSTPTRVMAFKSRAEEQSVNVPFGVIREMFSAAFHIMESDDALVSREKFRQGVAALLGEQGEEAAHFLGHALGFDFGTSPHLRPVLNDPALIYRRAAHYASQLLKTLASESPVLLILDDIHWADDRTLELMGVLLEECAQSPVIFIFAARPSFYERHPGWHQRDLEHVRVDLTPLTREDSRLLVYEILKKVRDLPAEFQDVLFGNAEGNPFYLEEMIKMMIDEGAIVKSEEEWWVNPERLKTLKIPGTLTGVLQARLDRLSPSERDLLQKAAIIGRIFWDHAVSYVGSHSPDQDLPVLNSLQQKELVFPRSETSFEDTNEYLFKHSILRDVAYEQILKSERRKYHRRAAEWLILRAGERAGVLAAIIAEHFERAGHPDLALEWYIRAAKFAQASYAVDLSIRYYRTALGLQSRSTSLVDRYELLEGLGGVLMIGSDYDAALESFQKALDIATDMQDLPRMARAHIQLFEILARMDDIPAALTMATRARAFAEKMEPVDPSILAQAIWGLGTAHYEQGDIDRAMDYLYESLAISEISNSRPQIASNYNMIGLCYMQFGNFVLSEEMMQKSLAIWQELGHKEFEAALLSNIGEAQRLTGEYDAALHYYQKSFDVSGSYGGRLDQLVSLSNMGLCYYRMRNYSGALEMFDKVLNSPYFSRFLHQGELYAYLALTTAALGNATEAGTSARLSLRILNETGTPGEKAIAWAALGRAAGISDGVISIGTGADSFSITYVECFKRGLALIDDQKTRVHEQAELYWHWGLAELAMGNKPKAHEYLNEAQQKFAILGLPKMVDRLLADMAMLG